MSTVDNDAYFSEEDSKDGYDYLSNQRESDLEDSDENSPETPAFCYVPFFSGDLSVLLLHQNIAEADLQEPNYFYNSSFNVRPEPLSGSLLESGILVSTAESFSSESSSPLAGDYTLVLTSFNDLTRGEVHDDAPPLFPVSGQQEDGPVPPNLTPATKPILMNAIAWLTGKTVAADDMEDDISLPELASAYIKELSSLQLRNSSSEKLVAFIRDRQWTCPLWGESVKARVDDTDAGSRVSWLELRNFISYNLSRQTKVAAFPVDSLHRLHAADTVLNGVWPATLDQHEALKKVRSALERRGDGPVTTYPPLEARIHLYFACPETLSTNLILQMCDKSVKSQQKA